jgi:ethanolamine ammonia-lyase small subunit
VTDIDPWHELRSRTQARIALGRAGDGLPTKHLLDFQLAHARARDAVHLPLDVAALCRALTDLDPQVVASAAADRATYLRRPDLGRRLSASADLSRETCEAVVVVADGLSARAVHENAAPVLRGVLAALPGWRWARPVIATQARVALGDEIAARVGARLVIMLIGERPGLSAPDSLGAYLTVDPKPGATRDADRNCISNIRAAGLSPADAARQIAALATLARARGVTGVALKADEALALRGRGEARAIKDLVLRSL